MPLSPLPQLPRQPLLVLQPLSRSRARHFPLCVCTRTQASKTSGMPTAGAEADGEAEIALAMTAALSKNRRAGADMSLRRPFLRGMGTRPAPLAALGATNGRAGGSTIGGSSGTRLGQAHGRRRMTLHGRQRLSHCRRASEQTLMATRSLSHAYGRKRRPQCRRLCSGC